MNAATTVVKMAFIPECGKCKYCKDKPKVGQLVELGAVIFFTCLTFTPHPTPQFGGNYTLRQAWILRQKAGRR